MNMKVLLHLCLTADSCIYSVPVAIARVREQQELLREGDELGAEGGCRAGCALSKGATAHKQGQGVIGPASVSGPRKGDR